MAAPWQKVGADFSGVTNVGVYDCTLNLMECHTRGVLTFPTVVIYRYGSELSRFSLSDSDPAPTAASLAAPLLKRLDPVATIESAEALAEVTSNPALGIGHVLIAQYPSQTPAGGAGQTAASVDAELRKLRELFHPLANLITINCETAADGLCARIGVDAPSVWLYDEPKGSVFEKPTRVALPPAPSTADGWLSAKAVHTALLKLLPSPPVIEPWTLTAVSAEGEYRLRREGLLVFFLGQKADSKSKVLDRIARELHASPQVWSANESIGIGIVHCRDGETDCDSAELGALSLPEVRL